MLESKMLEIWSLVPLPLWNPTFTSGSCQFTWSLAWKILSIALLACEMSTNTVIWTFFCIFFVRDWNENLSVPVLWPLLSFPNVLTYWVQHFNASSFMILNSAGGILSPPLALLVVMLPKAHLTSCFRISGSRWVTTISYLYVYAHEPVNVTSVVSASLQAHRP